MNDAFSIGVDLGGTNLRVAAYSSGVDFLETILLPTRLAAGRDQVVRDMCEAIEALAARHDRERRLAGIGVGTPGPLELPEGVLRNPPNLPGWDGFALRAAISGRLKRNILLEGDANSAALAEQRLGAGKRYGVDTLCMLTLGTGVGSGLIFGGKIWDGLTGMGGEAGHVIVKDEGGAPCGCGGSGCLEQYASATAVVRMARERMGNAAPATSEEIAGLARAGDVKARGIFDVVGHALAIALTDLINTLNLPLYVLGGGVCEAWDLFVPAMFRELRIRSYIYRLTEPSALEPEQLDKQKTYIMRAQLGTAAGLLGACLLGLEQPPDTSLSGDAQLVH
jgi:glucokinase